MKRSVPGAVPVAALVSPLLLLLALDTVPADAEPMFLSRQYTRCTSCHFSPTGGGLLTPYGRSLSRNELSTTGRSAPAAPPPARGHGEESFLWGALGGRLGPVSAGIDLRPSHLSLDLGGPGSSSRDFLMTADLLAAWQAHGLTVYGEVGRKPPIGAEPAGIYSYEHWLGYQSEKGLGLRVGRFLPAYGVRLADHTALTRSPLGFDKYDQVYALELSHSGERDLLQVSVGPGSADAIVHGNPHPSTATGRFQWDFGSHTSLVVSGLYRGKTTLVPSNRAGGIAFGFAPSRRLTIWSEADAQAEQGVSGAPAYSLLNETAFEVFRGFWLKVSPQLRTNYGDTSGGVFRLALETEWLPRTHWNLDVSYYRDATRGTGSVYQTLLAQLHLYL
jgi:hypothetical protein